jgi:GAF domain-containing protein/HAMP domain-containing protein
MSLRRLNFLHWSIRTKVLVIFLLANLTPLTIMVPLSGQRVENVRQQTETRLDTLGPFIMGRMQQTFENLIANLDDTLSASENYFLKSPTTVSELTQGEMRELTEPRLVQFMEQLPVITRVRFFDSQGQLLLETRREISGAVVTSNDTTLSAVSPANEIIAAEHFGLQYLTSDIYQGPNGDPLLDVIFTLRPAWDVSITSVVMGHTVFTYNMRQVAEDSTLPNIYRPLTDYPKSEQSTGVYLLDHAGRLISPHAEHTLFEDVSSSEGFQDAQQATGAASTYFSPLLGADVMGYHESVQLVAGPQVTLLIETPLEEINQQALNDVLFTLLPVALIGLAFGLVVTMLANNLIAHPIVRLTNAARQLSAGHLNVRAPAVRRRDEIGVLSTSFNEMAAQMTRAITELEDRVAERTRNLETTLEIGRVLTSIRDMDALLDEVVNLIRDQFQHIYHVQVFLIEPRTNQARLRASTGAVGRQLLQRGHYLDVGSQSVIGSVTASGHAVVALDTSNNPIHRRNEFLMETRAEMALPLRISDRIIGALDLQSKLPDAFSEQDVELFQGMADQLAIAIENALLFQESSERLQQIENLNRMLSRAAWQQVTRGREQQGLSAASGPGTPSLTEWSPLQQRAMDTRQIAERLDDGMITFAVPILLRDEVLGAVEWQVPEARYTSNTRQMAFELTARLALTADNIRLFEQSRRIAQRELLVNQISGKLTGTTDIDEILQTAVRELGLALRSPQTAIQLIAPQATPSNGQRDEDTQ